MLVSLCIPFLGKPVKGFAMNGSKFEPNGRYGAASARCLCTAALPRPSLVEPPRGLGQPSPLSSVLAPFSPALASVAPALASVSSALAALSALASVSSALASVAPALASVSSALASVSSVSHLCLRAGNRSFPGRATSAGGGFDLEKAKSRWKWGFAPDSIDFLRAPFC